MGHQRHFFAAAAAAEAMRRILVENARRKARLKRDADLAPEEYDEAAIPAPVKSDEVLAVDEALDKLEESHPDAAKTRQTEVFDGFAINKAAGLMGCSSRKANQIWTYARAWLRGEIGDLKSGDDASSKNDGQADCQADDHVRGESQGGENASNDSDIAPNPYWK